MQLIQSIQFTRLSQFELNAVIATYFNRFTIFTCYPDPLTSILQTDGPITIVVYLRAMHIEWVGWPDSCGGGEWRGGCTQRDFTGSAHTWVGWGPGGRWKESAEVADIFGLMDNSSLCYDV